MPLTGALVAGGAKAMTDLSWTEAFLFGALLSPTEPVTVTCLVAGARLVGDRRSRSLLTEDERELLGGPEAIRVSRPEGGAAVRETEGTQHVLVEEAVRTSKGADLSLAVAPHVPLLFHWAGMVRDSGSNY